jgi:regulator of sigma E protease
MVFLQNIWWYLVLIGVMILVHELGHYWAARLFDVKIETFSFGFGPRLFGFRRGETDFRFSAVLIGGYVKMAGDQPSDETAADPRSLMAKPRWQRLIITFAGPAINVIAAVAILTVLFMHQYPKAPMPNDPIVGYVVPDGPAAHAGIREGDQVVQIDGTPDPNWEDIRLKEISSARSPVQIWIKRNGERLHLTATPGYDEKEGGGYLGWTQQTEVKVGGYVKGVDVARRAGLAKGDLLVGINGQPVRSIYSLLEVLDHTKGQPVELAYSRNGQVRQVTLTPVQRNLDGQQRWVIGVELPSEVVMVKLSLPEALHESLRQNAQLSKLIFNFLEGIVERRMSPGAIAGPIRIAQFSGEAAREGPTAFFELMAGVSLNLAIFNLLPIPILDGGGMMMLLVEMLMRRDLDLRVREAVVRVGFVFLMMVVVFVIYNDISKILPPS